MKMKTSVLAATLLAAVAMPAVAQDAYRIGGVVSLTGPVGSVGVSFQRGSEVAIDMHKNRTVLGKPVIVLWEDDETKAQVSAQKGAKLAAQNLDMMLGSITTASTLPVMKITEQRKIPHIITLGGGDSITGADRTAYAWRTTVPLGMEDLALVAYVKDAKFKSMYHVGFGFQVNKDRWANFEKLVPANTTTKLAGVSFSPVENTDFALIIEAILRSGADAVSLDLPGTVATSFLKQAAQVGLEKKLKIFGTVLVDDETAKAVGPSAIGLTTGTRWHWTFDNAPSKAFVAAYKKKYNGELPDMYAGEAFDGLAWWLDVVEKTGSWDKEKQLAAFSNSVWTQSLKGKKTMRACDHQATQNAYWAEIVKGPSDAQPYTLKLTHTFPPEQVFPPCTN